MNCRKHTFVTMVLAGLLGMPALWGSSLLKEKHLFRKPPVQRLRGGAKRKPPKGNRTCRGKDQSKNLSAPISNVPVKPPFQEGGP